MEKKKRKTRSDKGGKHNYPKSLKTTTSLQMERIINILSTTKVKLEKRLQHNLKSFAKDKPHFISKHTNHIKKSILSIDEAIKSLQDRNFRPNANNMVIFENAWSWTHKKGALIPEEIVYDEKSNFKRLILDYLYEQGINIYNPSELGRILNGYTLDEIADAASWAADTTDEVNAHYYAIQEDALGYVRGIIGALNTQQRDSLKQLVNKA